MSLFYLTAACQEGWKEFNGGCYLFGHKLLTWEKAADYCKNLGANLVSIQNQEENDFIYSTFFSIFLTITSDNHT